MPFIRLPSNLKARIRNSIRQNAEAIDLSGYSLSSLSRSEFQDLVEYLESYPALQELNLSHCGLARVENIDLLYERLPHFTTLHTLDLSYNSLAYDEKFLFN